MLMTIEPTRDTLILRDTVVELSLVRKARVTGAQSPMLSVV
jgi:hypothetical protein